MFELRHNDEVVALVHEGGWVTLPNGDVFSPAVAGWSDDDGFALVVHVPPEHEPEPVDLVAYAADRRWQREVGGLTFGAFRIATDDRSKMMIIGARAAAAADPDFTTEWKMADNSFITLDAATIIAVSDAVLAHVAECFAIEAQVLAAIADGTVTTTTGIDTAFSA